MRHTTITDIAKRLGISESTVSRALSDHPDIKQETKVLVRKVAKELHYIPNPIARSLKNSRTTTIGVIVPEIKHDFFSSAISGIEEVAYHAGYTIIVCQSNESHEREVINTQALVRHRVAGLIVSISQTTVNSEHFQDVLRRKIPLVFFDRVCEDVVASKVVIDDHKSALNAVTYLLRKGYKKIFHFAGPEELIISKKRTQGYIDALQEYHIPVLEGSIRHGGLHEQDGYHSMDILIEEKNIPDAIFAVNDPVAIGALQRIREAGMKVPQDIALVGFSNNSITTLVDPPLTTVDQPSFEMGKRSAELLLHMIEEKENTPQTIVLETMLIERRST
jgi:DNA-binding LacI/PurR family transcriptional regulator